MTLQAGSEAREIDLESVFWVPGNDDDDDKDDDDDDDEKGLSYSATSSNSSIVAVSVSRTTLFVRPMASGNATVSVTATNDDGTATDEFTVTVTAAPNQAPQVVDGIDDVSLQQGASALQISLSGVFSDPDGDPLTFSATSSNSQVASVSTSGSTLSVTPLTVGTTQITVITSDGKGGTASDNFTVAVTSPPNRSPEVEVNLDDLTVMEGDSPVSIDLNGVFSDPDNDPLSFSATSSNTSVASASVSGQQLTITVGTAGTTDISVTARDGRGGSASEAFKVTVNEKPNSNPVVESSISDRTMEMGGSDLTINVSDVFRDPDNDPLTLSASSSSPTVATASLSGNTLTIRAIAVGTTTITLRASDGQDGTAADEFTVTVNQQENGAPVVRSPISDRELVLGGSDYIVDLSNVFSDPEDDPLTLSASSTNPSVATVTVTNSNLRVSAVSLGITTITVTATDDTGTSAVERFTITVRQGNRPPTVSRSIEDRQVVRGTAPISVTLDEVFTDPDEDPLTYSASSSNTSAASVALTEDELTVTPIGDGQAVITATANDRRGGEISTQFTVVVTSATAAVKTLPATDINSTSATLNGSINPAGQQIQYFFEYGTGDSYGETTPEREASGTGFQSFSEQVSGLTPNTTYHFRIVTTNRRGDTVYGDDETFSTASGPNRSPEVDNPVADRSIPLNGTGFTIDLQTVFRDPEGDNLVFAEPIVSEPGVISASIASGVLTIGPVAEGQVNVTIEARDTEGAVARDRFYVTVTTAPNQDPQIVQQIGEVLFQQGDSFRRIGLDDYFQDPENDPLVFEALSEDPTTATVQIKGDTLEILPHNPGETTVTVTAEDMRGGSASLQFTVRVTQRPNRAPTVSQDLADTQVQLGDAPLLIDIEPVFDDPDDDPLSYTASPGNPGIASSQIDGNQLTVTPVSAGQTTITVTAQDNHGSSAEVTFTLTVTTAGDVAVGEVEFQEQTSTGDDVTIRAQVENATGNSRVFLHYRRGGNALFSSTEMNLSGDMFEARIPSQEVTPNGLQWYIEVQDAEGASINSDYFSTRIEHPGFSIQQPGGNEQNAYRLISSPLELSNKSATAVLEDDLGSYDDSKWRFFSHMGGSQFKEGPSGVSFEPGRSYWLITRDNTAISTGSGLSLSLNDFSIELESGCNFVANPFNFPVPVSQVSLVQGEQVQLWTYNGQWNPAVTTLEPGLGYVICTPVADRMVVSPFPPTLAGKRLATSEVHALEWAIRVRAQSQNALDTYNYAAVSSSASEGLDDMDWIEPPVIGAYVSARFVSQKGKSAAYDLSTDVRPTQKDGYIWNLEVRSNIEDRVDLTFDQIDQVPADLEVWLIDESLQIQQNLRENNRYAFAASGEHTPRALQLVVGVPGFLAANPVVTAPVRFDVAQNHPNPFFSITTIRYDIPENEVVTVTIYDILGKEIVTLEESHNKSAGSYTVMWDGSDNRGVPVASGTYICRVQTRRQQASRVMTYIR